MPEDIIRIKDKRKGVFTVDNVVLNGYGKTLGATGIAFYVTLCRYANNQTQQAYPSITTIQNETGMDRKTIVSAAKRAAELGLVKRKVIPGKYTVYTLLEPKAHYQCGNSTSVEIPPTGGDSTPTGGDSTPTGGDSEENELRIRTKNTNLDEEEEHTAPAKKTNRICLSRSMLMALLKEFPGLSTSEAKEQAEKCNNYMAISSAEYKNPGLFFRGWLRTYMAEKRKSERMAKQQQEAMSKLPEMSEEQTEQNLERIARLKKDLKVKGVLNK